MAILFLCTSLPSYTQSFPVTSTVQFNATDLPYLSYYLQDNPSSLFYSLTLNDPVTTSYDVFLKIEIAGQGVSIRTKAGFKGQVFTLDFGIPTVLSGADLAEYFYPENLEFSGISREAFIQDGRLPEGMYTFCIEAFDINRPEPLPVSNRGCGIGMIQIHDPPIWFLPIDDISYSEVQNYIFQWVSQHIGGFQVAYDLVIFEAIPGLSEDQIIRTGSVAYIEDIPSNQYLYSPADPLLDPDKEYLAYIRVRDEAGTRFFKNDGVSQVKRFRIQSTCLIGGACDDGDPCTIDDVLDEDCNCIGIAGVDENNNGIPDICESEYSEYVLGIPNALPAEAVEKESFTAVWDTVSGADYYLLEVASDMDFTDLVDGFSSIQVNGTNATVNGLDLSQYQYYRVRAVRENKVSIYSNAIAVSTKEGCIPQPFAETDCNIPYEEIPLTSSKLITNLSIGDQVYAGGMAVTISDLGGNNPYTGSGFIPAPYTGNKARLNVSFTNITINESCQMIGDGYMQVTGAGVEVIDASIGEVISGIVEKLEEIDYETKRIDDILKDVNDLINEAEGVKDYFTNGIDVTKGGDGIKEEYPYFPDSTIQKIDEAIDCIKQAIESGSRPEICKEKWESTLKELVEEIEKQYESSIQIPFEKAENATYAHDEIPYVSPALSKIYQEIPIAEKPYPVHWKMLEAGAEDVVIADESKKGNATITYEYNNQEELTGPEIESKKRLLTITAAPNTTRQLYAVETKEDNSKKYAGKLNILSYDRKKIDLLIVPVNGTSYPYDLASLTAHLKKIYDPALVEVNVSLYSGIQVSSFDGIMPEDRSGLLENYIDAMDEINDAIQAEAGKHYLFIVDKHADPGKLGYWPRGRKYGYLFDESNRNRGQNQYEITVAHELAHGALKLAHLYDETDSPPGATQNVMDYGGGEELWGYQWNLIHNPQYEVPELDEDEEGQSVVKVSIDNINVNVWVTWDYAQTDFVSFITPAGQRFSIPPVINGFAVKFGLKINEGSTIYKPGTVSRLQIYSNTKKQYEAYSGWYINGQTKYFVGYARSQLDSESGKRIPDEDWFESSPVGIAKSIYLSARKQSDCKIEIVSGELSNTSAHQQRSVIPSEIDLSSLTQILENRELSSQECGENGNVFVFNYSSQPLDTARLNRLYKGLEPIEDTYAGTRRDSRYRLFFTDESTSAQEITELEELKDQFAEEVIWIHNERGIYSYRTKSASINNLEAYYQEIDFDFNDFLNYVGESADGMAGAVYELADFASRQIRRLEIPAYVWNNQDPNYDDSYLKVYAYIMQPLEPCREPANMLTQAIWDITLPENVHEFAFLCGVWNGAIEVVAGLPELIKIVGLLNTEKRAEFIKLWHQLRSYEGDVTAEGDTLKGAFYAIKDGLTEEFGPRGSAQFYHSVSKYGMTIMIAFVNPGSAATSGAGKILVPLVNTLKYIDNIAGNLIPLGIAFKAIKGGGKAIVQGGKELLFTIENEVFKASVISKGILEELILPIKEIDLSKAIVTRDGTLILQHKNTGYTFSGMSPRRIMAEALGITEEQLRKLTSMGLKEIEISDLIKQYEGTQFDIADIIKYTEDHVISAKDVFLKDLTKSKDFGEWVLGDAGKVEAWEDFSKASKNFSKTNPIVLEKYLKLSERNKALVLKFSDNADNSTLSKFLDDTNDQDFLAFINRAENENIVKGFVSHKNDVDLTNVSDEIAELVIEQIDNLAESDKTSKWFNRSTRLSSNKTRYAIARKFEDNNTILIIAGNDTPCAKWGGNGNRKHHSQLQLRADKSIKRVVLDDALIDPMPVAMDDLGNPIYKLIYHDSKLSNAAPWTPNQQSDIIKVFTKKNPPDFIEFEVRNGASYFTQKYPDSFINQNTKVRIYRGDVYKSISSGNGLQILETIKMFN